MSSKKNAKRKKRSSKAQRALETQRASQKPKKPAAKPAQYGKSAKKTGGGRLVGFFKKHWIWVAVAVLLAAGIATACLLLTGSGNGEVSGGDVSGADSADKGWPSNKYTLLIPKPGFDITVGETEEVATSSSDASAGDTSFSMMLYGVSSEELIDYFGVLQNRGFEIYGPDEQFAEYGVYIFDADSDKVHLAIYYGVDRCSFVITPKFGS